MNMDSLPLANVFDWRKSARSCPVTGLVVNRESERLVRWNGVVAIVFLLVGTIAALLLALTRWQAVHLLLFRDWKNGWLWTDALGCLAACAGLVAGHAVGLKLWKKRVL